MEITYRAETTPALFHGSDAFVRGLMGPIGSGKSVACCMEIVARCLRQRPWNGVRASRWAIVRNCYPELKSTTIKTWRQWISDDICPLKWDKPITGYLNCDLQDGTRVEAEILFIALDKDSDVKKLLSLDLTGVWFNEAREIAKPIFDGAQGRVGRYPAKEFGGSNWSGVICDTNPPDDQHWYYRLAEEEKPVIRLPDGSVAEFRFFRQPGALIFDGETYKENPLAENVQNHEHGINYWYRLLAGKDREWIKVYILGDYGTIFTGRPVYDGYWNDGRNVSPSPLGVYRGLPLLMGWDFGLTPACIIGQLSPRGQLRVLREYVCERGGIRQFASEVVKPALLNEFSGMSVISNADPAGLQQSQVDETSCIFELGRCGIPTIAARTNQFLARREAVMAFLSRTADGQPGLLLDPGCSMLRKGFNGGYQFSRVQTSGEERYRDVPTKNQYSHPHDALQYLALAADGTVNNIGAGGTARAEPQAAVVWSGAL